MGITFRSAPEFKSIEVFAEFLLADDRTEFTHEELLALNYRTRTIVAAIRSELESIGFTLAHRPSERRVRGFTTSSNDRWFGPGSCPTHGGCGVRQGVPRWYRGVRPQGLTPAPNVGRPGDRGVPRVGGLQGEAARSRLGLHRATARGGVSRKRWDGTYSPPKRPYSVVGSRLVPASTPLHQRVRERRRDLRKKRVGRPTMSVLPPPHGLLDVTTDGARFPRPPTLVVVASKLRKKREG